VLAQPETFGGWIWGRGCIDRISSLALLARETPRKTNCYCFVIVIVIVIVIIIIISINISITITISRGLKSHASCVRLMQSEV